MTSCRDHPEGGDNVLLDLGFDDAEELSAKAELALELNKLIDERGLSPMAAAAITGIALPKVLQVRRYKLHNISLERLVQALIAAEPVGVSLEFNKQVNASIVSRTTQAAKTAGKTV
jgi:predicted XRE-type DNA-binding protein